MINSLSLSLSLCGVYMRLVWCVYTCVCVVVWCGLCVMQSVCRVCVCVWCVFVVCVCVCGGGGLVFARLFAYVIVFMYECTEIVCVCVCVCVCACVCVCVSECDLCTETCPTACELLFSTSRMSLLTVNKRRHNGEPGQTRTDNSWIVEGSPSCVACRKACWGGISVKERWRDLNRLS